MTAKIVFHKVDQGTKAWLQLRQDYITASEMAIVMGKSPYKERTNLTLYNDKINKIEPDMSNKKKLFERGHAAEEASRQWLKMTDYCFEPVVITNTKHLGMLASLDGYDHKQKVILEVKMRNERVLKEIKDGIIPEHDMIQIQTQLLLSEANYAEYFVTSFSGNDSAIIRIDHDADMQRQIIAAAEDFLRRLEEKNPPIEVSNSDHVVQDPIFCWIAEIKLRMEQDNAKLKELQNQAKDRYQNHDRVRGAGILMCRTSESKAIDYKKIVEDYENILLKEPSYDKSRYEKTRAGSIQFRWDNKNGSGNN